MTLLFALALALPVPVLPPGSGEPPSPAGTFVHWETPHVHPLDRTPDGRLLLAVNTPDARLEVLDLAGELPVLVAEIPVGLDPVSVRARTSEEAWVVNHVSDTISVVDLARGVVVATVKTDDEPADVVFAGGSAFVSCSQANTVLVFDPANLAAAPERIAIEAEDPRALAVSPDGGTVYAAIFESGNASTVIGGGKKGNDIIDFPPNGVQKPEGPYGGVNPPPNAGDAFEPPQTPTNPTPPKVALVVKKDGEGRWMDDNGGDWTELVSGDLSELSGRPPGWDVVDRDLAVIDVGTLEVSYVGGLMNLDMALAVNPVTGRVAVVGTDALNEVRYEPVLNGTFLRVVMASVDGESSRRVDLNPHLDYGASSARPAQRDRSLGDPRGIAWHPGGDWALVTGLGSNNVVVVDAEGARLPGDPIEVGEGPTGVLIDGERAYVLAKFASALSVVDLEAGAEVARVPFHDPSPAAVKAGRKHLYDTHAGSGLGHVACASCHVDARMDRLAWDLGDPAGEVEGLEDLNLAANHPLHFQSFTDFHPMKGPMLTQTLQDIIGKEPHHWRGDRTGLEAFAEAFVKLQGREEALDPESMQEFEDFLATIHFPPNPFRNFDNTLPSSLPLPGHYKTGRFGPEGEPLPDGDATRGLELYVPPGKIDQGAFACVTCHTLPVGIGPDLLWNPQLGAYEPIEVGPDGEHHHAINSMDGSQQRALKVPQLRNLHERTGMTMARATAYAGFGYAHDGAVPSIERFVSEPAFDVASDQDVADLVAFLLAFSGSDLPQGSLDDLDFPPGTPSQDTHAAVGAQTTLVDVPDAGSADEALVLDVLALADAGSVGLVAKGLRAGEPRGWAYLGAARWQSDVAGEVVSTAALLAGASPADPLTLTVVPDGSEVRIGIDRDADGVLDGDEAGR